MRLFGGVRLGQMGEQKELGMGKRRGGAGVKVWGPEQGRWKHFYAEEKLLMANPPPAPGAGPGGGKSEGWYCPPAAGLLLYWDFMNGMGRGERRIERERGRGAQQEARPRQEEA